MTCAYPTCSKPVYRRSNLGPAPRYCSPYCQKKANWNREPVEKIVHERRSPKEVCVDPSCFCHNPQRGAEWWRANAGEARA